MESWQQHKLTDKDTILLLLNADVSTRNITTGHNLELAGSPVSSKETILRPLVPRSELAFSDFPVSLMMHGTGQLSVRRESKSRSYVHGRYITLYTGAYALPDH